MAAELHVFAEWAPMLLLEGRTLDGGRSLREALSGVCDRLMGAGVSMRLHWVWPLLERHREPFSLEDYRRLLDVIAPFGARLSLWPVVERRAGYFLSARTSRRFEQRLADLGARLERHGLAGRVGLTVDLEPPLPWLLGRFRLPLDPPDPGSFHRLSASLRGLRDGGVVDRLQAAVVPGLSAVGAAPSPGRAYDDLILMAYGSFADPSGRLELSYPHISTALATLGIAAARLHGPGTRTVIGLGLLNRGVLVRESTFTRPSVFARAVELATRRDVRELALYGLCGVLCGPEGLVTPDLELTDRWEPISPRHVRKSAEIAPWIDPIVRRLGTSRDHSKG